VAIPGLLVYDADIPEQQKTKSKGEWMRRGLPIGVLVILAAPGFCLGASPAFAQMKKCTCDFAESKWEAYGTKAVCATFMHKGRTSCEVEFGGFGADPNVISALGGNPADYQMKRAQALTRYFQDVQNNNRDDLFDPKFLQTILPFLMRGAYLRPMADVPIDNIKRLDSAVVTFVEKNSSDVSDTFRGRKPPFSKQWDEAKIEVGRGFMTVDHPAGRIAVIYFSPE
jgi:hypothetical protein